MKKLYLCLMVLAITLIPVTQVIAEKPTPGYNTKVPESIMTPDKVKTRIGTLRFFDGIPTKETAAMLYDDSIALDCRPFVWPCGLGSISG